LVSGMIWFLPKPTELAPATPESIGILPGLPPAMVKPVHATFDSGQMTLDAGMLLLSAIEQRLRMWDRLAGCIADPRAPERVCHAMFDPTSTIPQKKRKKGNRLRQRFSVLALQPVWEPGRRASRLGGRVMPAAWKMLPTWPETPVRVLMRLPSFSMVASWSDLPPEK
jgi:hypothetical protein